MSSHSFKPIWDAISAHNHKKALQLLNDLITITDDDTRNKKALKSIVLSKLGDYNAALTEAESILDMPSPVANDYNLLGNLYLKTKQINKAEAAYLRAIALNDRYINAYLNLANLKFKSENLIEAEKLYRKVLSLNSAHIDASYYLSSIYLQQNKTDKANDIIEPLFKNNRDHPRLLNQWAQCQYLLGLNENMIRELGEHNFKQSTEIDAAWFLANAYYTEKQYRQAIETALFIKTMDPYYDQINALLGHCYLELEQFDESLKYYLLENEVTKDPDIYFNCAIIMEAKQRQKDAVRYYEDAIKLNNKYFQAYYNLGNLYLSQGAFESANKAYHKALQLEPNNLELQFIMSALDPETYSVPHHTPSSFVKNLFNQYAPYYDQHLKQTLNFQVPQLIINLLETNNILGENNAINTLDIGCGSGLIGDLFAANKDINLVGIDISDKMLELTKAKGRYKELIQADVQSLEPIDQHFQLIIASDIIPYLGDLNNFFNFCNKQLDHGGHLCFSYESLNPDLDVKFQLEKTLRFKHAHEYIAEMLTNNNFKLVTIENAILRTNHKEPIYGEIILAQAI